MLVVKLKDIETIRGTTAEWEGRHHTNGVELKEDIINSLPTTLEAVEFKHYRGEHYAVGVKKEDGKTTFLSPKWIKSISDDTLKATRIRDTSPIGRYLAISSTIYFDTSTLTLIEKKDVKLCTECGSVLDTYVGGGLCKKCYVNKYYYRRSYTYKPAPIFTGTQQRSDTDNPIWYGVELEYGINDKFELTKLVKEANHYLKSDSSIAQGSDGGVELVTHPHSFSSLMHKDSWVNGLENIDANTSTSNGCHVHVSRTAFTNDVHYALVYHLMHSMGKVGLIEELGGRSFTNYCSFEQHAVSIHKSTKKVKSGGGRSKWCNEESEHTVEFRFFAGTNKPEVLKRYIQLLDSIIKYTRYHRKSVSVKGWVAYVSKYVRKYKELDSFIKASTLDTSVIPNTIYRTPKIKVYTAAKMPLHLVDNVVGFKTASKTLDTVIYTSFEGKYLFFREQSGGYSDSVNREDILEYTVEV